MELGSARHDLEKLGNRSHTKESVTRAIRPRTFVGKSSAPLESVKSDRLLPILGKDCERSKERN
jgi:hypothetical protein